ncbi:hypothetical protein ACFU0X_20425 [Streptomyces cellulosae]|uniref:Uncharacterized protein n=1 Tax=Streptomyces cellulosae TaxID=1968 RepID=A0ABW6JLV0_STRCE
MNRTAHDLIDVHTRYTRTSTYQFGRSTVADHLTMSGWLARWYVTTAHAKDPSQVTVQADGTIVVHAQDADSKPCTDTYRPAP